MATRRLAAALWRHKAGFCSSTSCNSVALPTLPSWLPSAVSIFSRCTYSTAADSGNRTGTSVSSSGELYGGETLEQIRARIFGTHIGNGLSSGRKLLRKKLVGAKIAGYYGSNIEETDPLFEYLDEEKCAPWLYLFCHVESFLTFKFLVS